MDDQDRNISRRAGRIAYEGHVWMLENLSATRPLSVFDTSRMTRRELLAGQRHVLDRPRFQVSLPGSRRAHFAFVIMIEGAAGTGAKEDSGDSDPHRAGTPTLGPPELSERQRNDVAALAWEWYEPPGRREPRPQTYENAARRLGCTSKSLERRISELRAALVRRGYQQLDDLPMMCSFLVSACQAVGPEDFERLEAW